VSKKSKNDPKEKELTDDSQETNITHMVSLLRIIFIATSSGSPFPTFRFFARTTVEKTPLPCAAATSYRPSSISPIR